MSEAQTLAEKVFSELATAIVRGELAPGERLSEQALVTRYGGSRAPIREAIQKLEARNLVVRVPHAGARVVSLSLEELRDIYEVRLELESMACRLAAERMSDDEISALEKLLEEHARSIEADQGLSYYQKSGNLDFHYRIIEGSKNSRLHQMLCGDLYHIIRMYRYRTSTSSERPLQALKEHQRIVEAIKSRDPQLAELLMRRHIQVSLTNLETRLAHEARH
ncbi:MAG: GntR family transcriptional regulator [Thalassolituus maritimus]|uniref:Transcriptional regulator, GntR family n=1 Tax=Thalassolituus maritimus TaxID=484498 RepID=A0A1N7L8D7_9GAMM|nr:GntR family transcriptional regulator [Thalassolituus maritimus]MEC9255814.1 GntR family transcriptional regulator [Pseudomonadota bacterium]HCG80015.1 GntR family transcriptional regulator [Oceanospirillales bacterium]MEC9409282.1 GntR family transcriptional regulator [Pseudomonadota bacterium]TPD53913.1 MAG: GntR family transcriptional regulator [Thalassolituus maritimus]SIS70109.1 transcriptional regulator, GntR family [Thalassolituus maritimus]